MIARNNRLVMTSMEDTTGLRCIDVYRTQDGTVFWDEWRRDPEDPSGWHPTGRRDGPYKNKGTAVEAAKSAIDWLSP